MKLKVNMPDYKNGAVLEVMYVGPVENGSTIDLTDGQVAAFRNAGYDFTEGDGTIELYKEADQPAQSEQKSTGLPGVEEVAERERKKTTRKTEKAGDK